MGPKMLKSITNFQFRPERDYCHVYIPTVYEEEEKEKNKFFSPDLLLREVQCRRMTYEICLDNHNVYTVPLNYSLQYQYI